MAPKTLIYMPISCYICLTKYFCSMLTIGKCCCSSCSLTFCWSFIIRPKMLSYILLLISDVSDVLTRWPVVPGSLSLSLITCPSSPSSVAVKGLIVVAWDKGSNSSLIMDRSGHAKQTPPWPWGLMSKAFDFRHHFIVFSPPHAQIRLEKIIEIHRLSLRHCSTLQLNYVFQVSELSCLPTVGIILLTNYQIILENNINGTKKNNVASMYSLFSLLWSVMVKYGYKRLLLLCVSLKSLLDLSFMQRHCVYMLFLLQCYMDV